MMVDVTDATFETEVLQRSATTPVVVDLWAPWCGPCKTLGPMIEKIVDETNGKVVLAKINVDENPQASQAFQVQSIPAVFALAKGQIVDNFIGAQPEEKIREFVNGLLGDDVEAELMALVAAGDEASLRDAVGRDPKFRPAVLSLARLLIEAGDAAGALEVLAPLEVDEETEPFFAAARAGALPTDKKSTIEGRLSELLPTVKGNDGAREEFLGLLEELSLGDPDATADWRRQLSTQLF